jgi:hypothetical protein
MVCIFEVIKRTDDPKLAAAAAASQPAWPAPTIITSYSFNILKFILMAQIYNKNRKFCLQILPVNNSRRMIFGFREFFLGAKKCFLGARKCFLTTK